MAEDNAQSKYRDVGQSEAPIRYARISGTGW